MCAWQHTSQVGLSPTRPDAPGRYPKVGVIPHWPELESFGGQGAHREVGSEGLEENHRVVIEGSDPEDEPVGQRRAMVEPAVWRRRRLGSSPSYQGVCGRHGGEEASVTQGGLVWSEREVWPRYCGTHRRKGEGRRKQTSAWSHREVGANISGSEVSADTMPGFGLGNSTLERDQNKRTRIAAWVQRRWYAQKVCRRGKAPCFAESG